MSNSLENPNSLEKLPLTKFYPENLEIISVKISDEQVSIEMKSIDKFCKCPGCKKITSSIHSRHKRKIQDLPLLNKRTMLFISLYEFNCLNEECKNKTFTQSFDGFFNIKSRMTERLVDLIITTALQTSCEGSARILQSLNIKISGDTVIKTLIKYYENKELPKCGAIIGVDDFAFKKGKKYGTIIVDEKTHNPITILEGRNADTLKKWLQENKQVKMVTRDRASSYASAIKEILPDCMQIADRFHLYENVTNTVKKALNSEIPPTIAIKNDEIDSFEECKKKTQII